MNSDEILLMTVYAQGGPEQLQQLYSTMRTAWMLGHSTRVEKQFGGGRYMDSPICLYASKSVTPDWVCDCGETNCGLSPDCAHCEQDRPAQPPDWMAQPILDNVGRSV